MIKYDNFDLIYNKLKDYIYPILFYIAGLFVGALVYSKTDISSIVISIEKGQGNTFVSILLIKLSVYLLLYSLTVLLGLCLIGFPFINAIPLFIGIEISLKISYYYVEYGVKGIGYSLLLIIPEMSAFLSIIIFTIIKANSLSKYIFSSTIKNSDIEKEKNLKQYLKSFVIYISLILCISTINALAIYLLKPIIQI